MHARLGQQRGEPEEHERRERGGQQPARRDPREHDEARDRRQRERREQPVRRAPVGRARDDREAGPEDRGDREQPRPGADHDAFTGAPPAARAGRATAVSSGSVGCGRSSIRAEVRLRTTRACRPARDRAPRASRCAAS